MLMGEREKMGLSAYGQMVKRIYVMVLDDAHAMTSLSHRVAAVVGRTVGWRPSIGFLSTC